MSNLLELAIKAHGGLDRWREVKTLTAHIAATGGLWQLKGWPNVFADAQISIDPHRQHVEYFPFIKPGQRGVYQPDRTSILDSRGESAGERASPRDAFAGHTLTTPWDAQHLLYFGGYAAWTYLSTPFLFMLPGFQTEEITPWEENGETWRRLAVVFPTDVHSHSTRQIFYFDATGILRRHDYSVDVMGGTSSANYATEPEEFEGLIFPTKRRIYAIGPDNRPLLDRIAIAIDFDHIRLI